jgi:hypothetical protein
LQDEKFVKHLEERSAPWTHFLIEWLPKQHPSYHITNQDTPLLEWYKSSRAAMRDKVFTLLPCIAAEYYAKRAAYLNKVEEQRLREVLMQAIPINREGWSEDFPLPHIIFKSEMPATPPMRPKMPNGKPKSISVLDAVLGDQLSPSYTPQLSISPLEDLSYISTKFLETPLYLTPLPRDPPLSFTAHPPAATMSLEAKLLCIERWTLFSPSTGLPYLAREPREKKFEMCWSEHGVCDDVLIAWVKEMWWGIWVRQALVNYVGTFMRTLESQ